MLVFSEGTTSARGTLLPLKPGMFHEAAAADLPLQLVYLEFSEDDDSWIGDDTVGRHFFARFGYWRTSVKVVYRETLLRSTSNDPHEGRRLCDEASSWFHEKIVEELGELRVTPDV